MLRSARGLDPAGGDERDLLQTAVLRKPLCVCACMCVERVVEGCDFRMDAKTGGQLTLPTH